MQIYSQITSQALSEFTGILTVGYNLRIEHLRIEQNKNGSRQSNFEVSTSQEGTSLSPKAQKRRLTGKEKEDHQPTDSEGIP